MEYPKHFFKWSLADQEVWLVKRLQALHVEEDDVRRTLGQVRGGLKYEPLEDRPDLEYVKPESYGR